MSSHTAIVTGGSRGIGRGIVDRLLADGSHVLTCGRGDRPRDLPQDVAWITADVSDPDSAERLVGAAHDAFGHVSLLVNNAGVLVGRTVADSTDEDWEWLVGVNCRGVFNVCRAVLPEMADRGGVIVNIGSISGVVADPTSGLYNASKAFVQGLTRCNTVQPGWIETAMADEGFALARDPDAARRDAVSRHPAGRLGVPADIANAVAWLASDEARWVTGQTLTVDGGLTSASPLRPGWF
jgi:NAD(P)-dependent dehydrogenase (short-subunit alcohol dehydrogenase family)